MCLVNHNMYNGHPVERKNYYKLYIANNCKHSNLILSMDSMLILEIYVNNTSSTQFNETFIDPLRTVYIDNN